MVQIIDGRYRIIKENGAGGMGVVFHAYDEKLERDVAIKQMRVVGASEERVELFLKRFEREAKAMAKLFHPNIVPIYEYGRWQGSVYLVMGYMPNGNLKERLKGPIQVEEAISILLPVADALRFVHEQNMVHRDVKPSNILFGPNDAPMIADFGVVKMVEETKGTLTGLGGVGTPEYMAPEQRLKSFDHRVDQYALGIVFYEMVTGRKPFQGETPSDTILLHMTKSLPDPRKFTPGLSKEACNILKICLAKDPEDRYGSMADFQQALLALVEKSKFDLDTGLYKKKAITLEKNETSKEPDSLSEGETMLIESLPEPLTSQKEMENKVAGIKRLPVWAIVAGIGVIVLGLTIGLASKLVDLGTEDSSGSLALLATETNMPSMIPTETTMATVTKTMTPRKTAVVTKTSTPTHTPDPTLGIGSTMIRKKDGMEMVYIPAGAFMMGSENGSPDELPVHEVFLDSYWIDKFEVTNNQFSMFKSQTGYETKAEKSGTSYIYSEELGFHLVSGADWAHPEGIDSNINDKENHPVVHISWYDAQAYCEWAGGSLPTEAEWEKAAKGQNGKDYPWGDETPNCALVSFNRCLGDTQRVGSHPDGVSSYGVMDMAGNVWEWVADWYDGDFYSNSTDNPTGPAIGDYRILRGGSWVNSEDFIRVSNRGRDFPEITNYYNGFRCAFPESQP